MTRQEPPDEPRPPGSSTDPPEAGPAADQGPRPVGPPVDPYAASAGADGAKPPPDAPAGEPERFEAVPYRPDPFEADPYLAESPTRRDRVRTEQMRRNAEYHEAQRTEAPPYRAEAIGRFKWEAPIQTMPTDVIWPFVSRVKRGRRSDWPVLVFALVVAAIITLGCCLAGFASFSAWNPFDG